MADATSNLVVATYVHRQEQLRYPVGYISRYLGFARRVFWFGGAVEDAVALHELKKNHPLHDKLEVLHAAWGIARRGGGWEQTAIPRMLHHLYEHHPSITCVVTVPADIVILPRVVKPLLEAIRYNPDHIISGPYHNAQCHIDFGVPGRPSGPIAYTPQALAEVKAGRKRSLRLSEKSLHLGYLSLEACYHHYKGVAKREGICELYEQGDREAFVRHFADWAPGRPQLVGTAEPEFRPVISELGLEDEYREVSGYLDKWGSA